MFYHRTMLRNILFFRNVLGLGELSDKNLSDLGFCLGSYLVYAPFK